MCYIMIFFSSTQNTTYKQTAFEEKLQSESELKETKHTIHPNIASHKEWYEKDDDDMLKRNKKRKKREVESKSNKIGWFDKMDEGEWNKMEMGWYYTSYIQRYVHVYFLYSCCTLLYCTTFLFRFFLFFLRPFFCSFLL